MAETNQTYRPRQSVAVADAAGEQSCLVDFLCPSHPESGEALGVVGVPLPVGVVEVHKPVGVWHGALEQVNARLRAALGTFRDLQSQHQATLLQLSW